MATSTRATRASSDAKRVEGEEQGDYPAADQATEGAIGSMRHGLFAESYYHGEAPEPQGPVFDALYP